MGPTLVGAEGKKKQNLNYCWQTQSRQQEGGGVMLVCKAIALPLHPIGAARAALAFRGGPHLHVTSFHPLFVCSSGFAGTVSIQCWKLAAVDFPLAGVPPAYYEINLFKPPSPTAESSQKTHGKLFDCKVQTRDPLLLQSL